MSFNNNPKIISAHLMEQMMQKLESAQSPEEQQHVLTILKANPALMAAMITHKQAKLQQASVERAPAQQLHQMVSQNPGHVLDQGPSGSVAVAMLHQQQYGAVRPATGSIANTPSAMQKQALLQLMHLLRSPHSPEQQQQILTILKANPQLMAAFIKQRQAAELRQASNARTGKTLLQHSEDMLSQQLQHMCINQNSTQSMNNVQFQGDMLAHQIPYQALNEGPVTVLEHFSSENHVDTNIGN